MNAFYECLACVLNEVSNATNASDNQLLEYMTEPTGHSAK